MTIIAKNPDTQNILSVYIRAGKRVEIAAGGKLNLLSVLTKDEIAGSDVPYHIVEGEIIINDGSTDLGKVDAIDLVKGYNQKLVTDAEGHLPVAPAPRIGSSKTVITHNFCDPCTWYEASLREDGTDGYGKVLTSSDGYTTYRADGYLNWIDLSHGRITNEDFISGYGVEVTVDGYSKTEDTDYTVDYEDGYVIFNSALTSSEEVKATFSYENGSQFTIGPSAGKKLRILYTEAQFSVNSVIASPIEFQVWVYNPYDLPNKVPYGNPDVYKSGQDFANVGNGGSIIPAFAGLKEDIIIVPFNYSVVKDVCSSVGTEIRISTRNDIPIDGYFGTLAAYCLSEDI